MIRQIALLLVALLLMPGVSRASMEPPVVQPAALPAPPPPEVRSPVTLSGRLVYETRLASPHFALEGWVLLTPDTELLAALVGMEVTVTGYEESIPSIHLRRHLAVTEVMTVLEGELLPVAVAGEDRYEVNGWLLLTGESEPFDLKGMVGARVRVWGTARREPSIYMRPLFRVREMKAVQQGADRVPLLVTVGPRLPAFPVRPQLQQGHLLLPLRSVVEAAGGSVQWDAEQQACLVRVGERALTLVIGNQELDGTAYLPAAPALMDGHTMVPAQFFGLLGLHLRWSGGLLAIDVP